MDRKANKTNFWSKTNFLKIFIFLLILILLILASIELFKPQPTEINICKEVQGFPAWADKDNNIIAYGLITIGKSSQEFSDNLTNVLIEDNISFVYLEGCSYCNLQKSVFGEENFNQLEKRGLTINCSKWLM